MAKVAKIDQNQDFFNITIDVFKLIGPSWNAFMVNLNTLLWLFLFALIVFGFSISLAVLPLLTNNYHFTSDIAIRLGIFGVVAFIVSIFLMPAITITQLESVRGNKISLLAALKKATKIALPFLGLSVVCVLIVVVGLILLVIPGILAIFFLSMAMFIFIDKQLGIKETIKHSYQIVKNNWHLVFAMFLVQIIVSLLGTLPSIGWIINLVLSFAYFCLSAVVYMQIRR
jgi:hypothetical protein